MKSGRNFGLAALLAVACCACSPLFERSAKLTYVLFGLALLLSVTAGILKPRKWFALTGVLVIVVIAFVIFVYEASYVGRHGGI